MEGGRKSGGDSSPKAISNSSGIVKNTTEGGRKERCVCGV